MRIKRFTLVVVAAVATVFYFRAFLPQHLDPDFLVYGQSAGIPPCTACRFIKSITPANVTTGSSQEVVIEGMNLGVGSLGVSFSGTGVNATVQDGATNTTATATITATAQALLGARLVTLSGPNGSSGTFCCFLVKSSTPGPVLDAITPTTANAGASNTTITLTGSGFDASSIVRINGFDIITTFVNSSQLEAQIPTNMLSASGLLGVTVGNSGNTTSDFKVFTVLSTSTPVLLGILPRGLAPGTTASGFLIGSNLLGASSVSVNGAGVSVTILPGATTSQVPVSINVASNAPAGPLLATVTTPAGNSFSTVSQFVVAAGGGKWSLTPPLQATRLSHTATLLATGKVLVAGGYFNNSAEIYDPDAGNWTPANAMSVRRELHTATLLSSGKVLAVGGVDFGLNPAETLMSSDLFDPGTNTWAPTGSLNQERFGHSSTLLNDGRVLVAGGAGQSQPENSLNSAELYDPATGMWAPTGNMNVPRYHHQATMLQNGTVMVTGGQSNSSIHLTEVEVYDPQTGVWTAITPMNIARSFHTATLLPGDEILVTGGWNQRKSVEIFNPISASWALAASMAIERSGHRAILLSSGNILMVGGTNSAANAELYDRAKNQWTLVLPAYMSAIGHTATLLPNGQILVTGGYASGIVSRVSEIFELSPKKVRGQITSN